MNSNKKTQTADDGWWAKGSASREYLEAIIMAVFLALFLRAFIVQAFKIPSGSMQPTLQIGDHLLVNKFIYGIRVPGTEKRMFSFRQPQRDDVIVFKYPQDPKKDFIKRVKAIPGDRIEIRNKVVYVNGEKIEDEYAYYDVMPGRGKRQGDNLAPQVIPEGSVFVMGDNRDHSHDSRFWGTVPIADILGKAFVLYFSWDRKAYRPRWERFGLKIP